MSQDAILAALNESQRAAVTSVHGQLSILAGPGSGKTHTLTSRTAWLLSRGLQPWNIIVATFTVKAAREMKERIGKLVGVSSSSKLILGTFHSIARRYLAQYGHLIDIRKDFGIADSVDSLAIIKRITKRHRFTIDPKVARARISGIKARGGSTMDRENKPGAKSSSTQEFETCYLEYEDALHRSNLLDYDDLILRCVDLLREHPNCVANVEAVLIDEFQDTNIVQFDLSRLFAAHKNQITIVGDPDQSIYGFRAAEIRNYKRMLHQYPDSVTIALEENYRSSGAILLTALSVIEQDGNRVPKSLLATHTVGTRPVLRQLSNARMEAEWIATEIKRILGLTGELLELSDFAILLRSASISRLIESSLGNAGIAYRMVGGLRFYDRLEVKTILDYLRVVNQPGNNDAVARIINSPSRRIGDVTVKSLLEEADESKTTLWSLILGVVQGKRVAKTKLPKQTGQGLSLFCDIILTARKKFANSTEKLISIVELMKYIIKRTNYERWLEENHGDTQKARWANVEELLTQATDFEDLVSSGYEDDSLPIIDGIKQEGEIGDAGHLSRFLANVSLASEVKSDENGQGQTPQVTISTIHAAKGLEWPVVFIPATYRGSIPHSRAEDTNEERRLLYVAMTRAKALLYMSFPSKNSQGEKTEPSPFLSPTAVPPLLDQRGPELRLSAEISQISHILRRAIPSVASISKSSSSLPSLEDDLFTTPNEDLDLDERLNAATGISNYIMSQRATKRRRVELGNSSRTFKESDWKLGCTKTIDRNSTINCLSVASRAGFVSAGSHLHALKENAAGSAARAGNIEATIRSSSQPVNKYASNFKTKKFVGKETLARFFGKYESEESKLLTIDNMRRGPVQSGIEPSLASHHVGPQIGIRPPTRVIEAEEIRGNYDFLSSSPSRPRSESVEPPPELSLQPSKVLTAKSTLFLNRPALTNHETTVDMLQQASTTSTNKRKTLGVKRSMNGWSSRKGFVPPMLNRR